MATLLSRFIQSHATPAVADPPWRPDRVAATRWARLGDAGGGRLFGGSPIL